MQKFLAYLMFLMLCGCSHQKDGVFENESYGFNFPANWFFSKDISSEGSDVEIKHEDQLIYITTFSLYIDEIPEGVNSYKDWHELQFKGNDSADLHSINQVEIGDQKATKVVYSGSFGSLSNLINHAYYFNRYLEDSANNKIVGAILSYVDGADQKLIDEGESIINGLQIKNLNW